MEKYWIDGDKRFKEQNTISTSSVKAMRIEKRNVSENTISLDNFMWGICRFMTCRVPSFFVMKIIPTEENRNPKNCVAKRLACSRGLGMVH